MSFLASVLAPNQVKVLCYTLLFSGELLYANLQSAE